MGKTRANVSGKIDQLVDSSPVIDESFYEDLTDILIMADAGVKTSETIIARCGTGAAATASRPPPPPARR
jgi:signal recognition particle GTPase